MRKVYAGAFADGGGRLSGWGAGKRILGRLRGLHVGIYFDNGLDRIYRRPSTVNDETFERKGG